MGNSLFNEAFVDEIIRIKVAEERERDDLTGAEARRAMRNLALGAGAFGLGAGAGGLALRYGLPKLLPNLSSGQRAGLIASSGVLAAGSALALRKAIKRNRELLRDKA